jgi:hypothetical protein
VLMSAVTGHSHTQDCIHAGREDAATVFQSDSVGGHDEKGSPWVCDNSKYEREVQINQLIYCHVASALRASRCSQWFRYNTFAFPIGLENMAIVAHSIFAGYARDKNFHFILMG